MSYEIRRTDRAGDHLHEIVQYIAADSGDIETALGYLDVLENAIMLLRDQPYLGVVPRYLALKRQGYRILVEQQHLVFYKVDDAKHMVTIHAVVHGKRAYRNLI